MAKMKFYSAWYCPFAQRAWMTLLLKGIDFEYIEVDPYRSSKWWLSISRNTSKVPVIIAKDSDGQSEMTIVDSTRVVEYLDELVPDKQPLLPKTPNERAEQRYWMDHINQHIVPYLYRFLQAKDEDEYRDNSRRHLVQGVKKFAEALSERGPYFNGSEVGIVDILLVPFAYRIDVLLGHYRDFHLPLDGECREKYRRWYESMLDLPAFKTTSTDHENYRERLIEFYFPYSQGEGQKDVAQVH